MWHVTLFGNVVTVLTYPTEKRAREVVNEVRDERRAGLHEGLFEITVSKVNFACDLRDFSTEPDCTEQTIIFEGDR